MFRKEIKPLSESMIDAIGNTINKLEYVEEKVNVKGIQKAIDDGKSMDVIMTMFANKRTTNTDEIRKVAKEYMWKKRKMKEEVEGLEEARTLSASDFEGEDPPKGIDYDTSNLRKVNWKLYDDKELKTLLNQIDERLKYEDGGAYEEAILKAIRAEMKKRGLKEEVELEEKMDPVGKADADIDNDGDVDSSDKYLHARRKAISKAMKKRKMNEQDTKMGTITVNSDEERKKRAAAYRAKKMKSEEVELDESDKTSLKKHIEKLKKMYKDEEKKNKARNNPYSSPEMSQIAQAIDVYEKRLKEEVELDEAKSATGYTIYHKTFSSAVQHAISQVEKQGYTVDEEEWDRKVAMGPKKPSAGKTNSYTIPLLKNGKPTPRKLQMQVYYDEGRYELNMYIS